VVRIAFLAAALAFAGLLASDTSFAQSSTSGPGNARGDQADSEFWRDIRQGAQGSVSIPDQQAGRLIQSEGDSWRAIRNGPLSKWGGWALFGTLALVSLFFLARGRIKIDAGPSGRTMVRFNGIERMSHWLLAVSFIILALTGLNMLYGRYTLLPLLGPEVFAFITGIGKWLHNYVAFGFIAGLVLVFLLWVKHNIPDMHDLRWINRGGGLFSAHSHPPARKFNAGQKLVFWVVILAGASISISGISLLFPFQTHFFGDTFDALRWVGFTWLPGDLTLVQEMQYSQIWHSMIAFGFIAVVIAHIYIGTLGMEGAFDAMGSGEVDENWAKEHHSLWVEEMRRKGQAVDTRSTAQPAE
jgi:formate dehydrogenase subunit gamma